MALMCTIVGIRPWDRQTDRQTDKWTNHSIGLCPLTVEWGGTINSSAVHSISTYTIRATDDGVKESLSRATEWQLASQQNVQHHAERPYVHRLATRLHPDHFRRHVVRTANVTCHAARLHVHIVIPSDLSLFRPASAHRH